MTADTDTVRRVRRLENETDSIYELIETTSCEVKLTLARHEAILEDLKEALADHKTQLTSLDATMYGQTDTLTTHTIRLARIGASLSVYSLKLDTIENGLTEVLRRLPEPTS